MRRSFIGLLVALLVGNLAPASAEPSAWAPTLAVAPYGPYFVAAFNEGAAYVVQQNATGRSVDVFASSDFGSTWSLLPSLPSGGKAQVDFLSSSTGVATVDDRLFRTTDSARTWERIEEPWESPAEIDFVEAAADGKSVVVATRVWRDSSGDAWRWGPGCPDHRMERLELFVSHDAGTTWKRREVTGAPVWASTADFVDNRHGAIVVSNEIKYEKIGDCLYTGDVYQGRRVLVTDDGGRTFREAYECPAQTGCLAVDRSSRRHVVVGTTDGAIAASFDGGRTFHDARLEGIEAPSARDDYRWVLDIDFADNRLGYALTNGRGIWRTADGGRTWAREASPADAPRAQYDNPGRIAAPDDGHAVAVGPRSS